MLSRCVYAFEYEVLPNFFFFLRKEINSDLCDEFDTSE